MIEQAIWWVGAVLLVVSGAAVTLAVVAAIIMGVLALWWRALKNIHGAFFVMAAMRERRARAEGRVPAINPDDGGNDSAKLEFLLDNASDIYLPALQRSLPSMTREAVAEAMIEMKRVERGAEPASTTGAAEVSA